MLTYLANFVIRHRALVISLIMVVTCALASQIRNLQIIIDPATALPQQHPYVIGTNLAEKVFGSNYMLVVAISPKEGDIYQPEVLERVRKVSDELLKIPGIQKDTLMSLSARRAKAIEGVADGIDVQPLMDKTPTSDADMARLRRAVALNPLYIDSVVAKDGKAAAITVTMQKGEVGFRDGIEKVYALADSVRTPGISVAVSGFPMYLAQLEIYSQRMVLLFPMALLVVGILHFEAFRSLQGFFLPLVTALLSVVWGLGIMGLAHVPLDAFNAVTPILILAVTAGHAVQLLKRYYEENDRLSLIGHSPRNANRLAVVASLEKVGPVMIAAGSVAVASFFSLMSSPVATIQTFGAFTGLGILSGLVIELTFIPALRSWLPPPRPYGARRPSRSPWDWVTARVARLTTGRNRKTIYLVTVAGVALFALGISRITYDNSTKSYFWPSLPFQQDDRAINSEMGGTNTLYVVFEGKDDDAIKEPGVLRLIDETQDFINHQEGVGKSVSLADLIKRLNRAMHGDDEAYSVIPDSKNMISQYLLLYSMVGEPSDFDSYVDYGYRTAIITAYLKYDNSTYVNNLISTLNRFLDQHNDSRVKIHIGGSVPETAALSRVLVESKFQNIAQVAAVVFLVSAVIFRSLVAGLLVLIPLAVTVVVNYGFMGFTGIPLNTPNSISAALGVGIGADYAIYLLYRIREELCGGISDMTEAVRSALRSAGKAVLYVGSAIAGGYSVLTLSYGFNVHIWFGVLIVLSMIVSVVSSLFLVPSLLMTLRPRFLTRTLRQASRVESMALPVLVFLIVLGGIAASPTVAGAATDPTAIMDRNYAVTRFDNSISDSTMTLVSKGGEQRVRKVLSVTRLTGNGIDNQRMTRFQSPPDIRNTVTMMMEHWDGDDETLIYLPALRKIRRLAASNKKDAFVGSDLSYGDVIGYRTGDWVHTVLRDEVLDGEHCVVIASVPKNDSVKATSGYSKRVSWISTRTYLAVRTEYFDLGGDLVKIGLQGSPLQVDRAKDRWQPMHMEMRNVQTGHRTILDFSNINVNQTLGDDYFTTRYMEREE